MVSHESTKAEKALLDHLKRYYRNEQVEKIEVVSALIYPARLVTFASGRQGFFELAGDGESWHKVKRMKNLKALK